MDLLAFSEYILSWNLCEEFVDPISSKCSSFIQAGKFAYDF